METGKPLQQKDIFHLQEGTELLRADSTRIILPAKPWMPTHAGIEIRVEDPQAGRLVGGHAASDTMTEELLHAARVGVMGAEMAGVFAEVADPTSPDWYDKPWFNLNFNSRLGKEPFDHLVAQIYLRARTMGQMEGKARSEYDHESNYWSNPYWTVPIPVDAPLNFSDRVPYEPYITQSVGNRINGYASTGKMEQVLASQLFTEADGSNSLEKSFTFAIGKGNYPVWQMGDYLIVTQDNPLVDREDGIHMVLIYRGEQEGPEKRYSFLWRDPRRIAEMTAIAVATSKIVTAQGYAGNTFDSSFVHMNANWSLAQPVAENDPEKNALMEHQASGPGSWPEKEGKIADPPNAHPHIQLLKPGHEFDLAFSPRLHRKKIKARQTDAEIAALSDLLSAQLTPQIRQLAGKTLQ